MRSPARLLLPILVVSAGLASLHYLPRLSALAFILRASKPHGPLGRLARMTAISVARQPIRTVATRHGQVATQLYQPARAAHRTVLLVPGLHMDGLAEERLVGLATDLAASGLQVLTVAPPDLMRYRVSTDSVDQLEDVAHWATEQPTLAPDGKVALAAVSFAGALAVVAAGRAAIKDRVAFVLSLGGYADLPRVLRYLCGETLDLATAVPGESIWVTGWQHIRVPKPNDYGAVVALLNLGDRLVPGAQVPLLEKAITEFLRASSIDRTLPERAQAILAEVRQLGDSLPEPSRTLVKEVSERDVDQLGRALQTTLAALELPAALSPDRSPAPLAPVFLLHGADDSVVPASEMVWLARYLHAKTRVRALASRLISHAEINPGAAWSEMLQLSSFFSDLMGR
ncbi:MAG: hypothetical protein ABSB49_19575 [Polyangia bacterium]|jgi:pimeloyl-ACP methyl ester carboxylesterase